MSIMYWNALGAVFVISIFVTIFICIVTFTIISFKRKSFSRETEADVYSILIIGSIIAFVLALLTTVTMWEVLGKGLFGVV